MAVQVIVEAAIVSGDGIGVPVAAYVVAEYWPAFARHGKNGITVGHVLGHVTGLTCPPPDLAPEILFDQGAATELSTVPPHSESCTATDDQDGTYGRLVAEILCHTTSRTVDELLRDGVARPLVIEGDYGLHACRGHPDAVLRRRLLSAPA
ncbi:serine hydrolase domain-containing protein [Streptomyces sp. NPDC060035]|uniref:serine hydrolase domain-containing protein n=1 Tax=Streptomyces sp. NPDC060035 TaxID=3347044 RepID=UPI00367BA25D